MSFRKFDEWWESLPLEIRSRMNAADCEFVWISRDAEFKRLENRMTKNEWLDTVNVNDVLSDQELATILALIKDGAHTKAIDYLDECLDAAWERR